MANVHPSLLRFFCEKAEHTLSDEKLPEVINQKDKEKKTALDYALQSNVCKEKANVVLLLDYHAEFGDSIPQFSENDNDKLEAYVHKATHTLGFRKRPLDFCLKLVNHLRERGKKHMFEETKDRFEATYTELENVAVTLMGDAAKAVDRKETAEIVSDENVNLAKKSGLKKVNILQFCRDRWALRFCTN